MPANKNLILVRQLITAINELIKKQLIAILDHPDFIELLSTWSCIRYLLLVSNKDSIRIRILDLKWHEVKYLVTMGTELNSSISQKIFNELDLPGNDPLSIIVANYALDITDKNTSDILSHFGEISSYVFAPLITSINSKIFGIEEFSQLSRINIDIAYYDNKFRYLAAVSKNNYANFIGLVIPKALFPSLINTQNSSSILGLDIKNYTYILGNGAYMFAAIVINSFMNTGWFLDITGKSTNTLINDNEDNEGNKKINSDIFFTSFYDNIPDIFYKYTTECFISENKEKELADLGLVTLCHTQNRNFATLYSANSLKNFNLKTVSDQQSKIAGGLQYILCVSRFAHYIKIIGRQKLGLYSNASEFQDYLNNWLLQYISSDIETPLYLKHKYPLMEAKVIVTEDNFLQDAYICSIHLKPHLISAQLSANILLKTKFYKAK